MTPDQFGSGATLSVGIAAGGVLTEAVRSLAPEVAGALTITSIATLWLYTTSVETSRL